jgi:hypothetical protein
MPEEFKVKSFFEICLGRARSEAERNPDENWIRERNQFARSLNLQLMGIAAQDLQCEYVAGNLAIQNVSVRLTLARVISYRTALQAGHPALVTFAIGGIGRAFIAFMLRKYGRLIHYSEKRVTGIRCKAYDGPPPIKLGYRSNKFF